MSDRIKSYKLSPQLKAQLGLSRRSDKKFDLPFDLPALQKIKAVKIPWRALLVTVAVFLLVVGGYIGVKRAYEIAEQKSKAAEVARQKDYENKLKNMRGEVAVAGTDAYSFITLSQKYLKSGDGERAVTAAEIATEKDPKWRDTFLNLGQMYLSVNQFESAKGALESSLEIDPLCGQAHYLLSLTYQELNKQDQAKVEFAKAKQFGFETDIGG